METSISCFLNIDHLTAWLPLLGRDLVPDLPASLHTAHVQAAVQAVAQLELVAGWCSYASPGEASRSASPDSVL